MNLWLRYIKERLGKLSIERENGFAVYQFVDWNSTRAVYIEDIYVTEDCREAGLAAAMADEIAKIARKEHCTTLVGSVAPNSANATRSLKVLLAYGFELAFVDYKNNLIMFQKAL